MQVVRVEDSPQADSLERIAWILLGELLFSSTLFQTATGLGERAVRTHTQ